MVEGQGIVCKIADLSGISDILEVLTVAAQTEHLWVQFQKYSTGAELSRADF